MINLIENITNEKALANAVRRFRDKGILLPTFEQQRNPALVPEKIRKKLRATGLWEIDPVNLFRITWKNEPVEHGGLFGAVNYIELPPELTGVSARIALLTGKWFPTGAHKVGAAYGCLVPYIVTGRFDPSVQKAVWPSTGNYCRGGAFDSKIMETGSVAILPEGMSRERFEWLRDVAQSEIIATYGTESNVKEIYDKCHEIRQTRPDCVIFNQFDEFGNAAWHYNITGNAAEEVISHMAGNGAKLAAYVSATGSAGTLAAGDYLKSLDPSVRIVASEALQCPTLLMNGFGSHRIEGIGDKHVPWIHNVRNTDAVAAIDDEACLRIFRLFNESQGQKLLIERGVPADIVKKLNLLGISGIANMLAAIKTARYYEMSDKDIIISIATDSADMYLSRLQELKDSEGEYRMISAELAFESCIKSCSIDYFRELTYPERKAIHNLKYFTWVEQQGKDSADLTSLWYDKELWKKLFSQTERWDELIRLFNERTGLS